MKSYGNGSHAWGQSLSHWPSPSSYSQPWGKVLLLYTSQVRETAAQQ